MKNLTKLFIVGILVFTIASCSKENRIKKIINGQNWKVTCVELPVPTSSIGSSAVTVLNIIPFDRITFKTTGFISDTMLFDMKYCGSNIKYHNSTVVSPFGIIGAGLYVMDPITRVVTKVPQKWEVNNNIIDLDKLGKLEVLSCTKSTMRVKYFETVFNLEIL